MAEKGRLAVFHGTGKPFEIREYPVPEPEPGAILVRIALANVCGSDMHYWKGEQDYEKMGRPLPLSFFRGPAGMSRKLVEGSCARSSMRDRSTLRQFRGAEPCRRSRAPRR
jgi:hypothetical protein